MRATTTSTLVLATVTLSTSAATLATVTVLLGWWSPSTAEALAVAGGALLAAAGFLGLALHRPAPAPQRPERWALRGRRPVAWG
ncbi:hypothetical protein [Angustibacter aerolatus]|uniref:Uncharacterized protein n=1 Tax=Angustibacter aerolatus TaxID=1162965 RepID=A0ABQ6JN72_9ACTN|nr:hypothetical protein [Angustibacter aerolatus]GMA88700.1 hypothetical protein GCM10025868_39500 [Angustibacter aerolatus]